MRKVLAALLSLLLGAFVARPSPVVMCSAESAPPDSAGGVSADSGSLPATVQYATQGADIPVDQSLVNKKVVVRLRDGRTVKGKLVEIKGTALRVKTGKVIEELALSEVASVDRQKGSGWKIGLAIAAAAVAVWVVVGLVVASNEH